MGRKPRSKMSQAQRAKQFAPFQSLGELASALRRAEEEHKRDLENRGAVHIAFEEDTWKVQD